MTVCGGEVVRHDISESRDLRTRVGIREYLGEKVVPVIAFYTRQFRLCNTSFLRTFMLSNMNVSRDIFNVSELEFCTATDTSSYRALQS
jgi:hypothetical protein